MDSTDHLPLSPLQGAAHAEGLGAVVLELRGAITRSDIHALCARVQALLEKRGAAVVVCDVAGVSAPDCGTVDALARMQLTAKRMGGGLRLRGASNELHELLAMAGLCDVVGVCGGYASS